MTLWKLHDIINKHRGKKYKTLYLYLERAPSELDGYFGRNHANFPDLHQVAAFDQDQGNKMSDPQDSTYRSREQNWASKMPPGPCKC